MSDKKHGLGRGLSALLGDAPRAETGPMRGGGVRTLPVAAIRPNPDQPRKHFDEAALDELGESLAQHGILQPILVRADGDGFVIIAGERRWRAAQRAQLHEMPAIVRDGSEASVAPAAEPAMAKSPRPDRRAPTDRGSASHRRSRRTTAPPPRAPGPGPG